MQNQHQQFTLSRANQFKKVVLIACLAIATSQSVYADFLPGKERLGQCHHQGMPAGNGGMVGMGMPPHLRGLKLSAAQEDKIFAMFHAEMPKIHEAMKARQNLYTELRSLGKAEPYNESQVRALAENLAALERDFVINKTRMDNKVYGLLSPEQRAQLEKSEAEDAGRMTPSHFSFPKEHRHHSTAI